MTVAPSAASSNSSAVVAKPVPIVVHGSGGRMGQRILALAAADPQFRIVAGVARKAGKVSDYGIDSDAPVLTSLPEAQAETLRTVVIDFSHPGALPGLAAACAEARHGLVSGTTGIVPADLDRAFAAVSGTVPVLWAPNTSLGVNVVFKLAAQLAKALGEDYDIELVEAHHNQKKDAPSGTALGIADAILHATGRTRADLVHGREGQVGARKKNEIGMHALRLGDVVGEHSAYFCGNGERITLTHQAHSRDVFARGALRAAAFIARAKPGRYTMADVLGL